MLAVCLLFVSVLSGCSSNNNTQNANSKSNTPNPAPSNVQEKPKNNKEVITLNFWGGVPEESGPGQVVENWNKANPNIQVKYYRFVNDEAGNTKLETALLASGEVDLFMNYRMDKVAKRVEAGMAEPLDSYIQNDNFDIEDNFGSSSIVKLQDKTFYIPAIILNDFVTINKTYLDEAQLPIPKQWTWDEYKQYAEKMTKGNGPDKVWGTVVGSVPKVYEWMDKAVKVALGSNAIYKEDGTSNFDNPVFKQYLDDQMELQIELKAQPNYAEAKATKLDGHHTFLSSKAAMFWVGTASIRNIKNLKDYPHDFVTAFAPVPKMSKEDKFETAGTGYLDFMSINARSKYKDAAWQFLQWYVTEGNEPMIPFGRVPAWKKADPDKVVSMVLGENPEKLFDVESFKSILFLDKEFIVDTKFNKIPEIQKVVEEEGERAYIGEQTSEEAVANMKKRADELLKQ